jgi:uncharacterized protein YndB with AHSA1/START domain
MTSLPFKTDPKLDLVLERNIDVPVDLVWKAWTTPEHLRHWFVPKPWTVSECEIDLRPGGKFRTLMRGPNGEAFDNSGCYLDVVPNKRLVFTDTLLPDYRPAANPFFTAYLLLDGNGDSTRYTAVAMHGNEEARKKHEDMGFHDGWGTVVAQMVAFIKAGFRPTP